MEIQDSLIFLLILTPAACTPRRLRETAKGTLTLTVRLNGDL